MEGVFSGLRAEKCCRVDRGIQCDHEQADHRVFPPRILGRKAGPKDMVLEEALGVRLNSAASQEGFFPRRQRAAEVECESRKRPGHGREMEVDHPRPAEDKEAPEQDEGHVRDMNRKDEPRE